MRRSNGVYMAYILLLRTGLGHFAAVIEKYNLIIVFVRSLKILLKVFCIDKNKERLSKDVEFD